MKSCEFTSKEDSIAYIKYMLDKTFASINAEAEKQAELAQNRIKTKKIDSINKKLLNKYKPLTHTKPVTAIDAGRPKHNDGQTMFRND